MKKTYFIVILFMITGCSSKGLIPIPTNLLPELNTSPSSSANYGSVPKQYQKLLQTYLRENLPNPHNAKIEFVNTPRKISVTHLDEDLYGYRVCLSIDQKNNKNMYTGFKNHFFLIKNESVIMHLYDSGLLKIPFELCVQRSEEKTLYLDDIDDIETPTGTTVEEMDDPSLIKPKIKEEQKISKDIYIGCKVDNTEYTYVFNEYKNSLDQSIGTSSKSFLSVEFSKTHIFGKLENKEVLINRVTGTIYVTENDEEKRGICELKNKTKF
ncbi:MAG: hypothetical protein VX864_02825 [Pseudomonadota bacterium]|nr:hypothetical protein [Pseudomonadota bacterium]MED5430307.1 hypothetical protein [Pseudomonadota bacterium]